MSRLTPTYFENDIMVAKLWGVANSSGSLTFEWPWPLHMILCWSANGATRLAKLTVELEEIALTSSAFAIWNAYSISSSLAVMRWLKQRIRRSIPASLNFFLTALKVSGEVAIRHFRRAS